MQSQTPCSRRIAVAVAVSIVEVALASPFNTISGLEAVLKVLRVLVCGVLAEHLAVGGALEGLEASLALDGLGSGVLFTVRRGSRGAGSSWYSNVRL